jgi:hypothetical protein
MKLTKRCTLRKVDGWLGQVTIPGYSVGYRLLFSNWSQALQWMWDKLAEIQRRGWVDHVTDFPT